MLQILLYVLLFIVTVLGSGEVIILHHPQGISFKGHERLDESDLKEVYSASLGFSIEHSSGWSGLYITNPFKLCEAILPIFIDGISNLNVGKGHHYPLKTNEDDDLTFEAVKQRIEERYPSGNSKIVNINLSDGLNAISEYKFLHGIKQIKTSKKSYSFLKPNIEENQQFLQEIELINAIAKEIEGGVLKRDFQPDYFRLKSLGLHAVSDLHGENSTATKEAKQALIDSINRLKDAFVKAYDGNILVTLVTSDVSHTRRARSLQEPESKPIADEVPDINLAVPYNSNYPVMFNIILWFGVVMVFTLIAITVTIANMDPGRDSIIYRMTSTRMKKDN